MTQHSTIVPIQLTDSPVPKPAPTPKLALACKLVRGETEVRVYNGIDTYILFAVLKELKDNAR